MPALNLFKRPSDKPRISIRERLRCASARILPPSTKGHRREGGMVLHVDPAYAAIEECRQAWAAYGQALEDRDSVGLPECDEPGPLADAAMDAMYRWNDAWDRVQATRPATLAGAAALASYMVESVKDQGSLDVGDQALEALANRLREMAEARGQRVPLRDRAKAIAATTAKILHFPKRHRNEEAKGLHPDQALLDLGAKFDAQWALINAWPDDDEAGFNMQSGRWDDIERAIGRLKPTTLEGLAVKARVAELYAGRRTDPNSNSTQGLALAALVDSVLSLAERGAQFPQVADAEADADLMQAIAAYAEYMVAFERHEQELWRREEEYGARKPPVPDALRYRDSDQEFGLTREQAFNQNGRYWWGYGAIDAVKGMKVHRTGFRRPLPGDNAPPDAEWYIVTAEWPEAAARKREILDAWGAYVAETNRIRDEVGLPHADKMTAIMVERSSELRRVVIEKQARTWAGVMAKARQITSLIPDEHEREGAIASEIGAHGPTADCLALSVGLDLALLLKAHE